MNRGAVEEVEFDHSHISGGLSKINTADNVIGIFTSRAMREHGRYQIQLMKTRSSNGVGSKVDLGFDVDTLRIIDIDENDEYDSGKATTSSVVDKIRRGNANSETTSSNPTDGSSAPKIKTETDSTQLRSFLNNLGSDE